jgi:hyperosmotically inducible protein
MKTTKLLVTLTLLAMGTTVGCSGPSASPDVSDSIRKSLDQAGFKTVSVSQDRDKGIVTLGGQVASENDKSEAESLAKSFAGSQVVADQIAVIPVGVEKEAKAVNSDLDQGIENNLDAALIQNKMHDDVTYKVKSGVVTLTGEVNSEDKRTHAEQVATGVPNVHQGSQRSPGQESESQLNKGRSRALIDARMPESSTIDIRDRCPGSMSGINARRCTQWGCRA